MLLVGKQPGLHRLTVQGNVSTLSPTRWELDLSLELDGARGARHLSADSCASLADAAAVMFALMLNPDAKSVEPSSTAPASKRPSPPIGLEAELGPGLGFGIVPLPSPELTLGLGLHIGRAQWWLSGHGGPRHDLDVTGPAGGRVRWTALGTRACLRFGDGPLTFAPCVVSTLNRLAGRGQGIQNPNDGAISWVGLGAGATGSVLLESNVSAYLQLDVEAPLAHPRMYLQGLGELVRPGAAVVHVALGGRYRF